MLLRPTEDTGELGKSIFFERMRLFTQGEWIALLDEAVAKPKRVAPVRTDEEEERIRLQQVMQKIKLREISRARVVLTSSGVAPGTEATVAELTDPELRPTELSEQIPEACRSCAGVPPIELDADELLAALRSAGRGSAPDLSGTRYEHLRVLIEDEAA